jgi:hypothetical protein
MRLPRVRFTVRRMMVVVLCLGIVLHLAVTAWRVYPATRGSHVHTAVADMDPIPSDCLAMIRPPFWPTYARRLIGLSWTCRREGRWLLEICELDHPEINGSRIPDVFSPIYTREQTDLYMKLMKAKGRSVSYENGHLVHRP